MTARALSLVPPVPTVEDRIIAAMAERETLRARLAEVEQALATDVREWSYSKGFRVPLRVEQAKAAIEKEGDGG